MLGKIYKKMGMLSKGHVTEVDRADLVGEYIGRLRRKQEKQLILHVVAFYLLTKLIHWRDKAMMRKISEKK